MMNEENFKKACKHAWLYMLEDPERLPGFKEVIELEDCWFFGANDTLDGHTIFDNYLGILVSKDDLSIRPCHGGTEEHREISERRPIDLSEEFIESIKKSLLDEFLEKYKQKFNKDFVQNIQLYNTRDNVLKIIGQCLNRGIDVEEYYKELHKDSNNN